MQLETNQKYKWIFNAKNVIIQFTLMHYKILCYLFSVNNGLEYLYEPKFYFIIIKVLQIFLFVETEFAEIFKLVSNSGKQGFVNCEYDDHKYVRTVHLHMSNSSHMY